ncbi:zinc finger protein OZF-like [Nerophis ophidion]|uniref:zinc finger protein OZF-like n=1 Tax=Nerophis ophidion TaxID=159077 RepID=UPI002AE02240|nr:zinc finger protein OZF-like [Nerophis ophidion]
MCQVEMLRVFVNQRLTAAVEDIFLVLERRIAEYEEELSRTKEENERQRQLLDAVFKKHQVVLHRTDAQQRIGHQKESLSKSQGRNCSLKQDPQHSLVIEEEKNPLLPHIEEGEEVECLLGKEEADPTKFPLTVVSVKTEDHEHKPPESSQLHHSPNVQQLVGHQVEPLSLLVEVSSPLKQEEPQPPYIKEEEEELCITREGKCPVGQEEADLTKFPLTVVCVKTEDHEDKPPAYSQLHHSPSEEKSEVEAPSSSSPQHITEGDGDHIGGSQANNFIAPLTDSNDSTSQVDVNMEPHMKTQTGEKPLSCSICGKIISQQRYMQTHMRTHTGENNFSCSVCGKRFSHKRNIQIHMRTHTGEKPFICSVCGKGFPQKGSIQIHMKTHTGEKPFSCSVCGQLFSEKQNMRRHMKIHTKEKPFNCTVCGKIFAEKQNLQLHMRSHTGEKPFNCSLCSRKFSDKQNMQRHMKWHSGEKPFNCSVCAKGFVIKCRLTYHMRTHTGEKPFSCSVCNKRYIAKHALQRHMKTHTGK